MSGREYFDNIARKRRHIGSIALRLDELHYQATGSAAVRYDVDRVQTSPQNRMEMILAEIVPQIEDEYSRAIKEYHDAWHEAEQRVLDMPNAVYSELLQLRYLHDSFRPMRWEQIALAMGYSCDRVRHLHMAALKAFEKQYLQDAA